MQLICFIQISSGICLESDLSTAIIIIIIIIIIICLLLLPKPTYH
jgi:hypothetical protein